MSVKLMGRIFELDIPAAEKFQLIAMADYSRDDGTGCYPSIGTLAKKTSTSPRAVRYRMRSLEVAHFIECVGPSRLQSLEYTITPEKGDKSKLRRRIRGRYDEGGSLHNRRKGTPAPYAAPLQHIGTDTPASGVSEPRHIETATPAPYAANPLRTNYRRTKDRTSLAPFDQDKYIERLADLGISTALWQTYKSVREKLNRPIADGAEEIILKELLEMQNAGESAVAVLEQAVATTSWKLYRVRESGQQMESFEERRSRQSREALAKVFAPEIAELRRQNAVEAAAFSTIPLQRESFHEKRSRTSLENIAAAFAADIDGMARQNAVEAGVIDVTTVEQPSPVIEKLSEKKRKPSGQRAKMENLRLFP